MDVWKKTLIFVKWYKKNNFLQCGIQTPQLWTWLSLKVIELELSYRHLGMTKILNFNHKKKFYKNVQKWLRKGRKTKKIKSFLKIKFRYFLLFLFFLDNFTKINVFFQTSIKSSFLNRFWKFQKFKKCPTIMKKMRYKWSISIKCRYVKLAFTLVRIKKTHCRNTIR